MFSMKFLIFAAGVWGMAAFAQRAAPNDGIKIERLPEAKAGGNTYPQPRVLRPWRTQGRVQGQASSPDLPSWSRRRGFGHRETQETSRSSC